jgi:hypothetical protein
MLDKFFRVVDWSPNSIRIHVFGTYLAHLKIFFVIARVSRPRKNKDKNRG